jgi:hypothetical protein
MSADASRPFRRSQSRTIRVDAIDGTGEQVVLEVQSEKWLHAKTDRYRRVWSARRVGRLGWEASSSARKALRRAAYVPDGKRPAWLRDAVKRAERLR